MTTPTIGSILATNAAATAPPAAPASTSTSTTGLGSDFKTFLTLLTSQLKNQDPLSPLDTNQFTSQLVSFSQVEQAINENSKLANLVSLQSTNQTLSALPLVGHTIEYSDNQGALVNGKATFGYNLPSTAASANIVISDANGQVLYQTTAETASGFHSFTWDGSTIDGSTAPDGAYTFNVAAVASDKSTIQAALSAYGAVSSVSVDNGTASLHVGAVSEPLSKIKSITN
jgi:flagellar basal-body rod modification protein FlgD